MRQPDIPGPPVSCSGLGLQTRHCVLFYLCLALFFSAAVRSDDSKPAVDNSALSSGSGSTAGQVEKMEPFRTLVAAARAGSLSEVQRFLSQGVKVDDRQGARYSALFYASAGNHADVVRLLLEHGARPDRLERAGWTALMAAALHGHSDMIQLLAARGANVNRACDDGRTALFFAVQSGAVQAVERLLQLGARVNVQPGRDVMSAATPLILAVKLQYIDIVELLVNSDADPDLRDISGRRALEYAAEQGFEPVLRLLLAAGSDVNGTDAQGNTILHYLAVTDKLDSISLLLQAGADPQQRNQRGETPLYLASKAANPAVVNVFVARGSRKEKISAFFAAVHNGDAQSVQHLLAQGVGINTLSEGQESALMLAAAKGDAPLVQLLLSHGANIALRDADQRTALMHAVRAFPASVDVLHALLDAGADVHSVDRWGNSALLLAVDQQAVRVSKPVVAALLDAGSDAQLRNYAGRDAARLVRRSLRLEKLSRDETLYLAEILVLLES